MESSDKEESGLLEGEVSKDGAKILNGGWKKPLDDVIKIQEALKPLGYIVHGFEDKDGRVYLALLATKW